MGIMLVFVLMSFSIIGVIQEVQGDTVYPTKSEKQTVAAFILIAFIVIFGFTIYIRKNNGIHKPTFDKFKNN